WAHLERARSLQREDPEEAVESLERFLEHCPSRLRDLGSRRLTLWPKELWQRHLPALEQATASLPPAERLAALPKLWQVQFHARPLTDHAALRQQITRQLAEVRQSEQRSHPLWWAALEEGYGLTGDAGALETVKQERADALPCRAESIGYRLEKVMRTYVPDANDMQIKSKQLDFAAEQLPKAAADLDALDAACPADADISAWRFQLLEKQESAPPERVVSVVEAFLAAGASKSGPVRLSSPDYRVAKLLVERGVALERVPALIERAREQRPDLGKFGMPPSLRSQVEASLQRVEVDMARLAGRAQLALGKAEAARREGERASSLYRALDAEAHKGRLANLHENLSAFLADAGLAELPELVVEAEAEAAQVETSSWKDVEETLAEFSLTDLQGRTWTLADFEGRGVLINFWATWCVPCVAELPEIQALHEELAGVDGLTVVTFNTDRNIGKVQPFLDQRNFTFPILMAADFLPEGSRSLPQNWLVDRQQVVRKKSTGFSVDGPGEWRHSALEALRKVVGE
ncbi:MAG: TlpA disulfide reductase family protein, partial [Acidobacteriota bacterium]